MEEIGLPNIREIYRCTRQNRDYNVIRKYQGAIKSPQLKVKPTKKDHYLDQEIRLNCSPGPAHQGNHQNQWAKKQLLQPKRGEKTTYLDDITKRQKKLNFPSPNHYQVSPEWPEKKDQVKNVSEKTNFIDTCEVQADKIPGPGSYNLRTHLSKGPVDKKWIPHQPIKPRLDVSAEVGTYNPCPLDYNTFSRYQLHKSSSQPTLIPKNDKQNKQAKQNKVPQPGPGTYSTINCWPGKQPLKKNERNYLKYISKGPSPNVYH